MEKETDTFRQLLGKYAELSVAFAKRAVVLFEGDNFLELTFDVYTRPDDRPQLVMSSMHLVRQTLTPAQVIETAGVFQKNPKELLARFMEAETGMQTFFEYVQKNFSSGDLKPDSQVDLRRISDTVVQFTWFLNFGAIYDDQTLERVVGLMGAIRRCGYTHFIPTHGEDDWMNWVRRFKFYLIRNIK